MAKLFDIKIISGTAPGPYNVYYDVVNSSNYATVSSTSLPATGLTYTQLTTGNGVNVSVPDNSIKVILYNIQCNNQEEFIIPTSTPTPTPTTSPTPTPTPTTSPTPTPSATATPTPTPTLLPIQAQTLMTSCSCNGGADGTIIVSGVTGGDGGPYQSKLNVGGTYETISGSKTYTNLTSGSYTIYVKDNSNNEITIPVTVTQPTAQVATITVQQVPGQLDSDGILILNSTGGTWNKTYRLYKDESAPYSTCTDVLVATFTGITSGSTSITATGLTCGWYCLEVTDANGCVVNSGLNELICVTPEPTTSPTPTPTPTACMNGCFDTISDSYTPSNQTIQTHCLDFTQYPQATNGDTITVQYTAYNRPNRFNIYGNGFLIADSDWRGDDNTYSGPWGMAGSLAGPGDGTFQFTYDSSKTYELKVDVGPSNPTGYTQDVWIVQILCNGPSPTPSATPTTTPTPTPTPTPNIVIDQTTQINIFFDSSGSMSGTYTPLVNMRDNNLKTCLLPFYNNSVTAYNNYVKVISLGDERGFNWLATYTGTGASKVINIIFADESNPGYHPNTASFNPSATRTADYNTDIALLRSKLSQFSGSYYRGIFMRVATPGYNGYLEFLRAVKNGTGNYSGVNGLSDKPEIIVRENITPSSTASYYANEIILALQSLGYNVVAC